MRPVIIVFAKAPAPGLVKTRLSQSVGAQAAAELHEALTRDMLEMLESLADAVDVELHTDKSTAAWPERRVVRKIQAGGDLGERMYRALEDALRSPRPKAAIVGADLPALPASHLETLLASTADVSLGPSEDGGFYAIVCRRVHPNMFLGVTWSDARTLEQTVRAALACGLSAEVGPRWFDLDTPADLERLNACAELPRHLRAWLRRYRGRHDLQ
jgi:uncharacterized protein